MFAATARRERVAQERPAWKADAFAPASSLFSGVNWSVGLFGLMGYVFVIHSFRLNIGAAMIALSIVGVALRGRKLLLPPPLLWFGVWIIWGTVAIFWSPFPDLVVARAWDYAKLWVVFALIVNVLDDRPTARFYTVFWLAMVALFPIRGAFTNYLFGHNISGRFQWNFFFGNPNDLATYCLLPLAGCLSLLERERAGWVKLAAIGGVIIIPLVILATQSRGAVVGLAVFGAIVLWRLRRNALTWIVVPIAAVVVAMAAPKSVWDRLGRMVNLSSVETVGLADSSAEQRLEILRVGWTIFIEHPVGGVGLGVYPRVHETMVETRSNLSKFAGGGRDTHNTFLNIAAETGIVGLAMFVFGLLGSLLSGIRRRVNVVKMAAPKTANQLLTLEAGLIGYLVAAMFGTEHINAYPYLYMAIFMATAGTALSAQRSVQPLRGPSGIGSRKAIAQRSARLMPGRRATQPARP